jgi:hypothetical protein
MTAGSFLAAGEGMREWGSLICVEDIAYVGYALTLVALGITYRNVVGSLTVDVLHSMISWPLSTLTDPSSVI